MRWLPLALLLLARPVLGQVWPSHDWWTASGNILENPPTAHLFGGMAWDGFARGPWIARPFRDQAWKRLSVVAVGGAAWEVFQVAEIHRYPWKRAGWDWGATMIGALATEGFLALVHR